MNEWKEIALCDVIKLVSGGTPSKSNPSFWGGSYPWISAKDLKDFFIYDSELKLTDSGWYAAKNYVKAGTTFILVRGMTLLNDLPICVTKIDTAFNQDIKAVLPRDSKIERSFVPYLLLGNKDRIHGLVDLSGHGTGRLSTASINELIVKIPPERDRKLISTLLESLDNKITLNRKLNETLEQMARALFQSWFVDFDPVKAKLAAKRHGRDPERACMAAISGKLRIAAGKPSEERLDDQLPTADELDAAIAALDTLTEAQRQQLAETAGHFPDEFQDSELGLIPEDWGIACIGQMLELAYGKALKKTDRNPGPYPVYG